MTDHEAIQGEWLSIAPSQPGYRIPIGPELIGTKLRYELRPNSVPKQIFLEHRDPRGRPRSSVRGAYELSGDLLTIRWVSSDRVSPASLETTAVADSVLHLRRAP